MYLEGQPSSHIDGVLGVDLEGLVCSPHREKYVGEGMINPVITGHVLNVVPQFK